MNHVSVRAPLHSRISRWLAQQSPTSDRAGASTWVASIVDDFSAPPRITVAGRPGMPCQLLIDELGCDSGATLLAAPMFEIPAHADAVLLLCPYVSVVERSLRELPMAVHMLSVARPWPEVVAAAKTLVEQASGAVTDGSVASSPGPSPREVQLRRRLQEVACAFPQLRDELEELLWRK